MTEMGRYMRLLDQQRIHFPVARSYPTDREGPNGDIAASGIIVGKQAPRPGVGWRLVEFRDLGRGGQVALTNQVRRKLGSVVGGSPGIGPAKARHHRIEAGAIVLGRVQHGAEAPLIATSHGPHRARENGAGEAKLQFVHQLGPAFRASNLQTFEMSFDPLVGASEIAQAVLLAFHGLAPNAPQKRGIASMDLQHSGHDESGCLSR
jgi:hypothetical protein